MLSPIYHHHLRWVHMAISAVLFVAGLTLLLLPARALALELAGDTRIEIVPPIIQLAPNESRDVFVVVSNGGARSLETLKLACVAEVGITVTSESSGLPTGNVLCSQGELLRHPLQVPGLASGSSWAWRVHITNIGVGPPIRRVFFQVDYAQSSELASPASGIVVGTLEIQDPAVERVEQVAEVHIEAALNQLQEHRPGTLYLVVKNTSSLPITLTRVTYQTPRFVRLEPASYPALVIQPQEVQVQTYTANVVDSSEQGNHLLLFQATVEWSRSGAPSRGNLVASQKIDVGVLGESDLLKLLGVPSFLFLPGVLALTMFMGLWNNLRPKNPKISLDVKTPGFWLVAISLSILSALAYPWITERFGQTRSYLESYSLQDILFVWAGSIGAGVLAWAGTTVAVYAGRRWWRGRMEPSTRDDPIVILRKMLYNRVDYPPELKQIMVGGEKRNCFVILAAPAGETLWIAPPIQCELDDVAILKASQTIPGWHGFTDRFNAADRTRDMAKLIQLFEEGRRTGICKKIYWDPSAGLRGPHKVNPDQVEPSQARVRFINLD